MGLLLVYFDFCALWVFCMCFLIIFIFVFCLFLKVNEREKNIQLGGKGGGEDLGGIRREKHHQVIG